MPEDLFSGPEKTAARQPPSPSRQQEPRDGNSQRRGSFPVPPLSGKRKALNRSFSFFPAETEAMSALPNSRSFTINGPQDNSIAFSEIHDR
ncbi:hypothetical protein C1O51_11365 [Akkermansia muciniphila]|nr:hypothetical protein CUC06_10920 [Akkermansia muciniphila]MCO6189617.1 hypothetical protein [Akkermansia muciniphila]PNC70496.1 hypothetical protein CXU05_07020 [Akkermansia muciniphila]QAA42163.1 hypothetical protein C1I94_11640 [Akkermansia muciniphila]QAA44460.1 hypothetical protein C1I96_11195 [Akkermansia muciniphila]